MSRFEELDKLVKDGMMDKEAADDIKEKIMKFLICMPTGKDGIQDDAVIRNALLTAVNRITLMDEKSGEFEAGDGNQNMVTFEVSE